MHIHITDDVVLWVLRRALHHIAELLEESARDRSRAGSV